MVVCRNGHPITPGSGPCPQCGAGLRVLYCPDGHANTTAGATKCSRCDAVLSAENLSPEDREKAAAKRRSRQVGVFAFIASWLLNDAVLSLLKIVIKTNTPETARPDQQQMIGFSADGWWVSLIIAIVVGSIVASNVNGNLTPVRGFPSHGILWWSSVFSIVGGGVLAYHVVWLFQVGLGLYY